MNRNHPALPSIALILAVSALAWATPASATPTVTELSVGPAAAQWSLPAQDAGTLTISGPGDFYHREEIAAGG